MAMAKEAQRWGSKRDQSKAEEGSQLGKKRKRETLSSLRRSRERRPSQGEKEKKRKSNGRATERKWRMWRAGAGKPKWRVYMRRAHTRPAGRRAAGNADTGTACRASQGQGEAVAGCRLLGWVREGGERSRRAERKADRGK